MAINTPACAGHERPDIFFPAIEGRGRISKVRAEQFNRNIDEAKAICSSCNYSPMCYQDGLQPKNLLHGIWGGKLPAERIMDLGYDEETLPQAEGYKYLDGTGTATAVEGIFGMYRRWKEWSQVNR